MKQKIFLTSALAMGFVAPAFAEPSNTGTFPADGYMEEDYTYTNAATSDNMDGVYSGTVNAVAEYDIIDYIVNAGQYLPADSETVITCPAGSFCPGISGNVQYNQSASQGIQTCPTGYASSAAGASSDTQCYRTCTNNDVEHSTGTVNGEYYYGDNNQCEPTDCVNGWHLKQMNLTSIIGTGAGASSAHINNGQFGEYSAAHGQSYYGITDNNTWATDYGTNGMLIGQARCSTQSDSSGITTFASLVDETGQEGAMYCYCNVTGYTPNGGTMQAVSSPWVFRGGYGGSAATCAGGCAHFCATSMQFSNSLEYRAALLGSVTGFQSGPASCEANVININWNDVDPATAGQNNENTATYGSDVRTPVKAQTKKGKTFKGWRFSKPTETNLP